MPEEKQPNLAKVDNFLALQGDGTQVLEILRENLQGTRLTPFDLDRITVPAAGGVMWEINDIDEGVTAVKNLEGIVVYSAPSRSYWEQSLDEGQPSPPDCMSFDLVRGVGTPGGDCGTCPFNEFGTAQKGGRGKACSERRFLFMLRPDSFIPVVVQIPASSLKAMNQFLLRLAGRAVPYSGVVTSLSLEKATQAGGGLPYSRVIPAMAGRLSPDDLAKVKNIADSLKPMFQQTAERMASEPPAGEEEFIND